MGELITLAARRSARASDRAKRVRRRPARFYFDLACPFSYLAIERVERTFPDLVWVPVIGPTPRADGWSAAQRRAAELRMPLSEPERRPADAMSAMRVAASIADSDQVGRFALAASRLAFCGGFDLDDPEILTEAAAAAGVALDDCLEAARDQSRDLAMIDAGRALFAGGADRLPVLRIERTQYEGERQIHEVLAARRLAGAVARC